MTDEKTNKKSTVYINGKYENIDQKQAVSKFETAEKYLHENGMIPVNPMKDEIKTNQSKRERLINQIEIMMECDSIFVLDNWFDCEQSRVKVKIAEEYGFEIIYESDCYIKSTLIEQLKEAIFDIMGLKFEQYITNSRKNDYFYARMIFVNHCKNYEGMNLNKIGNLINRDHSTVMYSLKTYQNEIKYNQDFRETTRKVNKALNKCVSH